MFLNSLRYTHLDHTSSFNGNKHTCTNMHASYQITVYICSIPCLTYPHSIDVHQFCVVYIYYICDVHLVCLSHATGIGLTLNNVQYTNNSVVNIMDIGTGSAALLCTTTYRLCCFSNPPTHWYFPNGTLVDRVNTLPYYRSRIDAKMPPGSVGTVLLHRNPGATTTGVFRCDIRNRDGILQGIYVGIYTATTGKSLN